MTIVATFPDIRTVIITAYPVGQSKTSFPEQVEATTWAHPNRTGLRLVQGFVRFRHGAGIIRAYYYVMGWFTLHVVRAAKPHVALDAYESGGGWGSGSRSNIEFS